jgi:hypothetical protein
MLARESRLRQNYIGLHRKQQCGRSSGPRLVLAKPIGEVTSAMFRVRQSQNVEHGRLPLPTLRGSGRCRMLGIRSGGVRHPSSNETQLQPGTAFVAASGSNCCWNLRCRIPPAFAASKSPWFLFTTRIRRQDRYGIHPECCAYTIVEASRRAVNSLLCETPGRVTSPLPQSPTAADT